MFACTFNSFCTSTLLHNKITLDITLVIADNCNVGKRSYTTAKESLLHTQLVSPLKLTPFILPSE